jgi:hypothetical protein
MDVIDCNIRQKCYLEIKGFTNNEFYGWTFHKVFLGAFVVVDYVREKIGLPLVPLLIRLHIVKKLVVLL